MNDQNIDSIVYEIWTNDTPIDATERLWKLSEKEGRERVFAAIKNLPGNVRKKLYDWILDYYEGHRDNGRDSVHAFVFNPAIEGGFGIVAEVPKVWVASLLEYLRANGVGANPGGVANGRED